MTNYISRYPSSNREGYNNGNQGSSYDGLSAVDGLVVDGAYLDGSWELCVRVEDINDNICVRVRGDVSIGGLMHQIVEVVNIKQSWSDHAIWWPQRNMWLLHTRTSLDQYGVQSDAQLVFRRTHGNLQVVLPSMSPVVLRVNYASRVFSVVENICKELCIRHCEELSLMFPIKRDDLKSNQPLPVIRHGVKKTGPLTSIGGARSEMPSSHSNGVNGAFSMTKLNDSNAYPTLPYGSATLMRGQSVISLDEDRLDVTRFTDCRERKNAKSIFAEEWLIKPKGVIQKARMDSSWLDSSRSLMEHGIEPLAVPLGTEPVYPPKPPTLYLRFKYYNFYDLNTSYDFVRIHQLYEQARWSILAGNLDCTEDEMVVFAAYQLQAELQNDAALKSASVMFPSSGGTLARYATLGGYSTLACPMDTLRRPMSPTLNDRLYSSQPFGGSLLRMPSLGMVTSSGRALSPLVGSNADISFQDEPVEEVDDIDVMLSELEHSCNVSQQPKRSVANDAVDASSGVDPILQDSIKVFRDKGLLMRRFKEMWAVVKDGGLLLYRDPHSVETPVASYALRDCLIKPEVSLESAKFDAKLSIACSLPGSDASTATNGRRSRTRENLWLRFDSMEQYAKWVAAFRIAAAGKNPNSRAAFDKEFQLVRDAVAKQRMPDATPVLSPEELSNRLGDLSDFCADRIIKKARSKDFLRQRINEVHSGIRDLSLQDSKLRYINDWQRLNNFGRSYCLVQFEKNNSFGLGGSSGGIFSGGGPQEDFIAVRQGRIEVVSPTTEETTLAWNFADLRSWNVNWDNGNVILDFRNGKVSFKPLTANCKTVIELIGGYVFLNQRNPEKNQKIDERMFHKLTGVND